MENTYEAGRLLLINKPVDWTSFDVVKNGDAFDAEVVLDRSKFDVRYGSDSFFDNLGDNVILDDFTMRIHLVTK